MLRRICSLGAIVLAMFLPNVSFAQTASTSVESQVRSYFSDIPVMISIAQCESGFRQFNASGNVLHGGTGDMIGVFQLDAATHSAKAQSVGFDITTTSGNLGYARYLYGAEGTAPWISSFSCWNSATSTDLQSSSTSTSTPLTKDLSLGMSDPQVLILQQMLNVQGFALASSGPGSPGNETDKFGSLTREAVHSFQCAKGIVCTGDEYTTGYGLVNALTRAALMNGGTTTISTITISDSDTFARIAQLESQITALVAILNQLKAARGIL